VSVSLLTFTNTVPRDEHSLSLLDVSNSCPVRKAEALQTFASVQSEQKGLLSNPDCRFTILNSAGQRRLKDVAYIVQGSPLG